MILNAKYSISVARKIGACVFLSPADIVEGKVTYDSFFQIIHSRNALVVISYVFTLFAFAVRIIIKCAGKLRIYSTHVSTICDLVL